MIIKHPLRVSCVATIVCRIFRNMPAILNDTLLTRASSLFIGHRHLIKIQRLKIVKKLCRNRKILMIWMFKSQMSLKCINQQELLLLPPLNRLYFASFLPRSLDLLEGAEEYPDNIKHLCGSYTNESKKYVAISYLKIICHYPYKNYKARI